MKLKSLLMIFFLLAGSLYLQAQSPHVTSDGAAKLESSGILPNPTPVPFPNPTPIPIPALCTGLHNFKQECDINGNVVITFNVKNYTVNTVSNVWVYLDDFTTVASLGGTLLPGGTSSLITYHVPAGETNVCFNVRLLNTQGQPCCHTKFCYNIDECPCGDIGTTDIDCESNGVYEFCFEVHNPSYSANTVDGVMLSSSYPDLCINGIAAPAPIAISPIPPGTTSTVCVELEGCNSTIASGNLVTLTPHLLEFCDPSFCCALDPIAVTTPPCCDQFGSLAMAAPADCNASNGSVTIHVISGVAPYSITGIGGGGIFFGTSTTRNNLAAGTYNYTITDANGCVTTRTVVVTQSLCPCDISASPSGGDSGWNGSFNSTGSGFLCINFNTYSVPDQVIVTVNHPNGSSTIVDSEPFSSNRTTASANFSYPGCNGTVIGGNGSNFTASIPIGPGDAVDIEVLGSVCGTTGTAWALSANCQASPCLLFAPYPKIKSPMIIEYEVMAPRINNSINPSNALQVFPNPVSETLTIRNTNSDVQFETINILDASGKIIQAGSMSGNSEIRMDVSSLPRGIYFIDAMDNSGNKVTERFVKVE